MLDNASRLFLDNESQVAFDDPMPLECSIENIQESPAPEQTPEEGSEKPTPLPDLDPDILSALGEVTEDTPTFGEKIHDNLSKLWLPILRKGIEKEAKDKLMKQYQIPENCTLLQAPKLNPEIAATISDVTRNKDKRVESAQQQLGLGITALNKGLSLLLENDTDRVKAIKFLSDSSRLLCDLHHVETDVRKKFMTPGLDKSFLNLIQDVDRDDTLFGQKLSEKIKASKVIEKQGLQIKKLAPAKTPASSAQPSTSRVRSQVNWSGPSRYPSNRGGRGGYKKTGPAGRKAFQASMTKQSSSTQPQQNQTKSRAPAQQR